MSNYKNIHFHLENKDPTEHLGASRKFKLGTWTFTAGNDLVLTNKDKPAHTLSMSTLANVVSTCSIRRNISSLNTSSINGLVYPPFVSIPPALSVSTIGGRDYVSTSCLSGVSRIVSNNTTINFNDNLMNFLSTVSVSYINRTNANITSGAGIYDSNMNTFDTIFPRNVRITVIGGGANGAAGGVASGAVGNGGGGGGGGGRVIYTTLANNYVISYNANSNVDTHSESVVILSNIHTTNLLTLRARYGNPANNSTGGEGGDASGPPDSVATSGGNGNSGAAGNSGGFGGSGGGAGGGGGGGASGGGGGLVGGVGTTNGSTGTNGATYGDGGGGGGGGANPYIEGQGGSGGAGGLPLIKFEWL